MMETTYRSVIVERPTICDVCMQEFPYRILLGKMKFCHKCYCEYLSFIE